jgi:hypothetical protein
VVTARVILLGVIVAFTGCDKAKDDALGRAVTSWRDQGLEASTFSEVGTSELGQKCRVGVVAGLDVTVCEFGDAAQAKTAEEKGLTIVGEATGAAISHGNLLLVVADRRKADPDGKKLNQVTKSFRQL